MNKNPRLGARWVGPVMLLFVGWELPAASIETGSTYIHESGVYSVVATSSLVEASPASVRFTRTFASVGTVSGWDEVSFVKPELSNGRSAEALMEAIVADTSTGIYKSIRRAKARPQATVQESAAIELLGREAWYAKVLYPRYPGTGMTVFGDNGRQVDADFVAFLHLVPIRDLNLKQKDLPVEFLLLSSFRAVPLMRPGNTSHLEFRDSLQLVPEFAEEQYVGRYGFSVRIPAGHFGYAETFSKEKGETENLYIFPEGTPPEALKDESQFRPRGIVRIEAMPRQRGNRFLTLDIARKAFTAPLDERGETYEETPIELSNPAFQLTISAPIPLVQVAIETGNLLFLLTGGQEDEAFREIVRSVQVAEVAP